MKLTRREKHIVIASLFLLFVLAFIPQQIITDNEPLFLLVSAVPMGFYIAADPERINRRTHEKLEKDLQNTQPAGTGRTAYKNDPASTRTK